MARAPCELIIRETESTRPGKISNVTQEHYDQHAEEFWEGTRDHDVGQNIETLLKHIEGEAPFSNLDYGCGSG
jgi:hypothetical protein